MPLSIIQLLTSFALLLVFTLALTKWARLKKSVDSGAITVVNKHNGKTATLPRNYSPAAVEELLELTA